MIEMLGVLAIIGVLSVGGIAGYSKAMMKFKTNKTIDQIAMTVTNIRTLYAQQKTYTGLDSVNLYDLGVTDDAMGKSGTLTNPFGGGVSITVDDSGAYSTADEDTAFVITFSSLPREACIAIATNDWGSGYSSGMLGIAAGADNSTAAMLANCKTKGSTAAGADATYACSENTTSSSAVFTVAKAAAGCSSDASANEISLKYY